MDSTLDRLRREEELFPGMDWNMEIERAVETADAIIVCLSKGSITKEGYVQKEIRIALDYADYKPEGTLFIIPVRLEECTPPKRLARWQYADYFEGQRDRGLKRLLVSLESRKGLSEKLLVDKGNQASIGSVSVVNEINDNLEKYADADSLKNNRLNSLPRPEDGNVKFNIVQEFSLFSWKARLFYGLLLGIIIGVIFSLVDLADFEGSALLAFLIGVSSAIIYPSRYSLILLSLGFSIFGAVYFLYTGGFEHISDLYFFIYGGVFYGVPFGAVISRILYATKILK